MAPHSNKKDYRENGNVEYYKIREIYVTITGAYTVRFNVHSNQRGVTSTWPFNLFTYNCLLDLKERECELRMNEVRSHASLRRLHYAPKRLKEKGCNCYKTRNYNSCYRVTNFIPTCTLFRGLLCTLFYSILLAMAA